MNLVNLLLVLVSIYVLHNVKLLSCNFYFCMNFCEGFVIIHV